MSRTGRPKIEFLQDPDRHLMAMALAYKALGMSLRGGCEAAVATTEGLPVELNLNRGRGGHGMNLIDWKYELKRRPGAAATIEGRARGLRQKLKTQLKNAEAVRWLFPMSNMVLLALQRAALTDVTAVEQEIMRLAQLLGEIKYARDKLLPLARLVRSPLRHPASISHPNSAIRNVL